MRALIQRVLRSSVHVDNQIVNSIERGLCIFIGIQSDDDISDLEYIVKKILTVKLWPNGDKPWAQSVVDLDLSLLCISQFTLHALTAKGARPDFHLSMSSERSKQMYEQLINILKQNYKADKIFDGCFGAYMTVTIGQSFTSIFYF
ncbi:unnamed protein product [Rotaria sp. Silwood2]|nr:unnamed protein product [Rotaria sp. Silwood2]CAF3145455.1 unnamed protein product [Rotaria sp. Silwood2]CAF3297223.1 unnamed protein product [Rotaria sp. Silwood2]CAF4441947.1 unnamed protein product [Rotaria sp. Silwood2]CAF4518047.1 unnamed protein product [Rotaria sp. Silwood2]